MGDYLNDIRKTYGGTRDHHYLHHFHSIEEFEAEYYGDNYVAPWLAYIEDDERDIMKYNLTEYEKLLRTPLTLTFNEDGEFIFAASNSGLIIRTIEYSKNGGEWTSITSAPSSTTRVTVASGDTLALRGNNTTYCDENNNRSCFRSTGAFEIKGNILSLSYPTTFKDETTIPANYAYALLFSFNEALTDASKLILPATVLKTRSYYHMFYNCTGLLYGPELPKIESMEYQSMKSMFEGCTSLIKGPSAIGTKNTVLGNHCCGNMFYGCSNLEVAPELPASALTTNSYADMFNGCSKINYIKCLLANPRSNWLSYFTNGVSSTGTFVKKKGIEWPSGTAGIPTGWTVEEI